jgi:hypothetical protein
MTTLREFEEVLREQGIDSALKLLGSRLNHSQYATMVAMARVAS